MNRRHFTFGTLLGLLGIKASAQEKGLAYNVIIDEEFCPQGHAQKPLYVWIDGTIVNHPADEVTHHPEVKFDPICSGECMIPKEPIIKAYDTFKTNLHICSSCGIAYIPMKPTGIVTN